MKRIIEYIKLYFHLAKYKFQTISSKKYAVLLKFDDLEGVSPQLKKLDRIVRRQHLKICWGIIGKSLEKPTTKYVSYIQEKYKSKKYHFFNHGYLHTGYPDYEFFEKSVEDQRDSIQKTQKLVQEHTGILLNSFGAPCNHIDVNTAIALKDFPEIKYWFYGLDDNSPATNIKRIIDMENGVGKPDFYFFRKQWNKLPKSPNMYFTLQGHPLMWSGRSFLHFRCIVAFLKHEGCYFILPEEITAGGYHD